LAKAAGFALYLGEIYGKLRGFRRISARFTENCEVSPYLGEIGEMCAVCTGSREGQAGLRGCLRHAGRIVSR
jgi:hypothetical protein